MPQPSFVRLPRVPAMAVGALTLFTAFGLLAPTGNVAAPDKSAGERIAREGLPSQVAACISCHGAKGEGSAAFPPLAATGSAYLQAQLDAFASGARANVSAWFASLPSPQPAAPTEPPARHEDAGAWLAQRGNGAHGVPACSQCHGPGGIGVGEHFPPMGGLSSAYLQGQITAWKSGKRPQVRSA